MTADRYYVTLEPESDNPWDRDWWGFVDQGEARRWMMEQGQKHPTARITLRQHPRCLSRVCACTGDCIFRGEALAVFVPDSKQLEEKSGVSASGERPAYRRPRRSLPKRDSGCAPTHPPRAVTGDSTQP